MNIVKQLFSRRWFVPSLVVIGGMIFLARLGFWQLDRLDQRRAQNAALVAALAEPPLNLNSDFRREDFRKDREVMVQGEFDFSQQIILLAQTWQGQPGVHLVAPLVIEGGKTAVLVDRGWIPNPDGQSDGFDPFTETGLVTISGYLVPDKPGAEVTDNPQKAWYRLDISAIAAQMPYALLPIVVAQQAANPDDVQAELPYRNVLEIDLSEGSHLSYALQWFIFSGLLGVMYIAYVRRSLSEK